MPWQVIEATAAIKVTVAPELVIPAITVTTVIPVIRVEVTRTTQITAATPIWRLFKTRHRNRHPSQHLPQNRRLLRHQPWSQIT